MSAARIEPITPEPVPRLALTREELAASLGVSDRTISAMTANGELPYVRFGAAGGRILYPVDLLRRWLTERAKGEGVAPKVVKSA